jgi:hypothetical protein
VTSRRSPSRRTSGKSQLLEHGVNTLHALGFHVYESYPQFKKAIVVGERYVIRNYPCTSIYGTPGRKEALIVAPPSQGFITDGDGKVSIFVEAKWQEASGSVDEKMPFVWQSFLESKVPNWVVIMDGAAWRTTRGKAVVEWMQRRQPPEDKRWYVTNAKQFIHLATDTWGATS